MNTRVHEMMNIFSATDSREKDYGKGLYFQEYWAGQVDSDTLSRIYLGSIPTTQSMTLFCVSANRSTAFLDNGNMN